MTYRHDYLQKYQDNSIEKRTHFSTNCVGSSGYPCEKKRKLNHYLTLYTKINPKWVGDLEVNTKPLKKFYKEKIYLEVGHCLLDMTQQARTLRKTQKIKHCQSMF